MDQTWSILSRGLPLLEELKVTIGSLLTWDEQADPAMIAPSPKSRTFVAQKAPSFSGNVEPTEQANIICLEQEEARAAIAQGRPGPLLDHWQRQAELVEDFLAERNDPIYPEQHFVNGYETCGNPPTRNAFGTYGDGEHQEQMFKDALRAQHEAEVEEARHPTRTYY